RPGRRPGLAPRHDHGGAGVLRQHLGHPRRRPGGAGRRRHQDHPRAHPEHPADRRLDGRPLRVARASPTRRITAMFENAEMDHALDGYSAFERMLVRENTLLVKLWLHMTRRGIKRRLKKLEDDPDTSWRVTRQDRKLLKRYDDLRGVSEHLLRRTSTGDSP